MARTINTGRLPVGKRGLVSACFALCFALGCSAAGSLSVVAVAEGISQPPPQDTRVVATEMQEITSMAFGAEGAVLAWAGSSGIEVLALEGEAQPHRISQGEFRSLAFSPDGRLLAASGQTQVLLFEVETGSVRQILEVVGHFPVRIAFSPDGQLLASVGANPELQIWDVRSGEALAALDSGSGMSFALAFSPDGGILASGGDSGKIKLWLVGSRELVRTIAASGPRAKVIKAEHTLVGVAFTPDSRRLVSCTARGTVRVWHAGSGAQVRVHQAAAAGEWASLAVSASGRLAAVASQEGVYVSSTDSGETLLIVSTPPNKPPRAVAFGPGGLLAWGGRGQVGVQMLPPIPDTKVEMPLLQAGERSGQGEQTRDVEPLARLEVPPPAAAPGRAQEDPVQPAAALQQMPLALPASLPEPPVAAVPPSGELSRRAVHAVIHKHMADIQECFAVAVRRERCYQPELRVRWTVGTTGSVEEVDVDAGTDARPPPDWADCATRAIAGWSFPSPKRGGALVKHTFVLRASGFQECD